MHIRSSALLAFYGEWPTGQGASYMKSVFLRT